MYSKQQMYIDSLQSTELPGDIYDTGQDYWATPIGSPDDQVTGELGHQTFRSKVSDSSCNVMPSYYSIQEYNDRSLPMVFEITSRHIICIHIQSWARMDFVVDERGLEI